LSLVGVSFLLFVAIAISITIRFLSESSSSKIKAQQQPKKREPFWINEDATAAAIFGYLIL
jgi:hypothetical protein